MCDRTTIKIRSPGPKICPLNDLICLLPKHIRVTLLNTKKDIVLWHMLERKAVIFLPELDGSYKDS